MADLTDYDLHEEFMKWSERNGSTSDLGKLMATANEAIRALRAKCKGLNMHLAVRETCDHDDETAMKIDADNDKLRQALKKYGEHEVCCLMGDQCNCGFNAALKGGDDA